MAWDAYLKAKWDNENSDEYARKVATKEGREQGKLEIARNMKSKGFDVETISEITGLSQEEVRKA